ncbi:MAG: hypothetical protein WA765_12965 [Candidatus Acidiferrum sp.]
MSVTNITDHNVNVLVVPGPAPDQPTNYDIKVLDEQGREAAPTQFLRNLREHPTAPTGSVFGSMLPPGKSFEEKLALTRFYDLSRPGKYTVRVSRTQRPWRNTADSVKSNTITITVTQ